MHPSALDNGGLFFDTYLNAGEALTVLDIGAQDVNGSLRARAPAACRYIGVDFAPGRGVDVVLDMVAYTGKNPVPEGTAFNRKEIDAAAPELLQHGHGREAFVDDREVLAHGRHHRHQVQAPLGTLVVGYVVHLHAHSARAEDLLELRHSDCIRAVGATHGKRGVVDPKHVTAIGRRRSAQRRDGGDPRRRKISCESLALTDTHLFGRAQCDDPVADMGAQEMVP